MLKLWCMNTAIMNSFLKQEQLSVCVLRDEKIEEPYCSAAHHNSKCSSPSDTLAHHINDITSNLLKAIHVTKRTTEISLPPSPLKPKMHALKFHLSSTQAIDNGSREGCPFLLTTPLHSHLAQTTLFIS